MFLSDLDIWQHLKNGDLDIDPMPEQNQLTAFSVTLQLGNRFEMLPSEGRAGEVLGPPALLFPAEGKGPKTVRAGANIKLLASSTVLAATLESVRLPLDLAGLLFQLSRWQRLGLSVESGPVQPGFNGQLTLAIRNNNTVPILVSPGQRIVHLCLVPMTRAISTVEAPKRVLTASDRAVASRPPLSQLFSRVIAAKGRSKGKALEDLIAGIFSGLDGLRIIRRNARLQAEELDFVIENNLTTGFWKFAGSPIIVECKNWSRKVRAREISVLEANLRSQSPDAKGGILVALNGITGSSSRDATLKVREARQRGFYILILERSDLIDIVQGISLGEVIQRKHDATLVI